MKRKILSFVSLFLAASVSACSAVSGSAGENMPFIGKDGPFDGDMAGAEYYASEMAEELGGEPVFYDDLSINQISVSPGNFTAGEWIDNDHISFWEELNSLDETEWNKYSEIWQKDDTARTFVSVTLDEKPVENTVVTVTSSDSRTLWTSVTDNEGKAYLFYTPSSLEKGLTLNASYEKSSGTVALTYENYKNVSVTLSPSVSAQENKSLDLMLVADTTGSMGDELEYMQKELRNIINRVVSDNMNIPVRLSVNFYRDDGDEYIVRDFDFTDNISQAIADLKKQKADGGGDMPEKVNAALYSAINNHDWHSDATKLLFLLLDAPPHREDSHAVQEMNQLTAQAAEKGIRIIPILAGGGNKETEYLVRDMAMKTGGTYLFITDDSSVSAENQVQPTIGNYKAEQLNDLMVRVINRYLADVSAPAHYIDDKVDTVNIPELTADIQNKQETIVK